MVNRFLQSERLAKSCLGLLVLPSALLFCSLFAPSAKAATATTTTLTVTPSTSIPAQQIATITASVQAGGQPVAVGTVDFFDGKLYLGSVQVVRNTAHGYAVGTATLKTALGVGTHAIAATFLPTETFASNTSSSQVVTVRASGNVARSTVLMLTAQNASAGTSFATTLAAAGIPKATGSVVFSDQTTGTSLGTVSVNPANFSNDFSPILTLPIATFGIQSVDFNGDGLPDFVTTDGSAANQLRPYLSKGDGTFEAGTLIPGTSGNSSDTPLVLVADLNGDGVPDIACLESYNGNAIQGGPSGYQQMVVAPGLGDGTFGASQVVFTSPSQSILNNAVIADFNGDGVPDLGVAYTSGGYSSGIPLSTGYYIFPGKGDGTFGNPITATPPGPMGVSVVADFNGDGIADYASANTDSSTTPYTYSVQIMLGKGDGTFTLSGSYPAASEIGVYGLAAAQSRGNGITDLVVNYPGSIGLMLGNGDGTFLPEVIYPYTVQDPDPGQIRVGDVTGDGLQDIVVPKISVFDSTGSFTVYAGNGDGTYQPGVVYNLPPNTINTTGDLFAVADFNHDGVADIAGFNPSAGMIYVLSASSQGSATYSANFPFTATIYGQGVHQVVATYSGDSNFAASTSNILAVQAVAPPPPPSFTLAANPSTLSIVAGITGTVTLSVTPQNGFNSPVTFSCSGLPLNSTCSFSPASVTPNGAAATTMLTIATNVQAAANELPGKLRRGEGISFALLLGFVPFAGMRFARRGRGLTSAVDRFGMLLFFVGAVALTTGLVVGCGGSSGAPPSLRTPPGTSSVTVTAVQSGPSGTSAKVVLTVAVTK